jgi:hypothetical protein
MDWIAPELREDHGEIDAAIAHTLPALVTVADMRGDLHTHTNWTDGRDTLADMARRARDKGYADSGFRTVFNTNAEAGQTVFHIHLHVLAGRGLTWPPG